jgi:hypothetical protein
MRRQSASVLPQGEPNAGRDMRQLGGIVKASMRNVALSVVAGLTFGVALPAAAQDIPKLDVGIGYQAASSGDKHVAGLGDVSGFYKYGFNADGSVPLNEKLSVVAELGWMRDSIPELLKSPSTGEELPSTHANFNALNYGGGLRWNKRSEKMTPFAQFIVGVQRDTFDVGSGPAFGQLLNLKYTRNSIMVQPGGGVALAVNETMSVVGQVDYRYVNISGRGEDIDNGKNVIRFVIGLRFNQR